MKSVQIVTLIMFLAMTPSLMAQANNERQVIKMMDKARVEVVNGQKRLVLVTGVQPSASISHSGYPVDIVLELDDNLWRQMDSVLAAPMGSRFKTKDVNGYNVEVVHGNINSNSGLMFSSGTKLVAIMEDEFNKLK